MADNITDIVIADAEVLAVFMSTGRLDAFESHPCQFVITDHLAIDITQFYPEYQAHFDTAILQQTLTKITVVEPIELQTFASLSKDRSICRGECCAISVAIHRNYRLLTDNIETTKRAATTSNSLKILTVRGLINEMRSHGTLTSEAADMIQGKIIAPRNIETLTRYSGAVLPPPPICSGLRNPIIVSNVN